MPRKPSPKSLKAKADRLFSLLVRSRGFCEARWAHDRGLIGWHPTCAGNLETSHMLSRRYSHTRCDPSNALCLCSSAHRYVTADPGAHHQLVAEIHSPGHWDVLRASANRTTKVDWAAQVALLEQATEGL